MCTVCGCADTPRFEGAVKERPLPFGHVAAGTRQGHAHPHDHHHHGPDHHHYGSGAAGVSVPGLTQARLIEVETAILSKNDALAQGNRRVLQALQVLALNLVSSPGSGKTTLLEATADRLAPRLRMAVVDGDIATERDADRLRARGVPAHQILTGGACHLDARQVEKALEVAAFGPLDVLFVENVGNLICPTSYDLGEDLKIVLLSVAEGDDKPFKYPAIFARAALAVITKVDLLPHVDFDLEAVRGQVASLNPSGALLLTSARTGEGMEAWCREIERRLAAKRR